MRSTLVVAIVTSSEHLGEAVLQDKIAKAQIQ
jgi:hypothetical protein